MPNIINLNFFFLVNKVLKFFGGWDLGAHFHEVKGSNLDECVHQCILYKYNVQTCTSWQMMSKLEKKF
jgi:hypothetical protein